MLIAIAFERPTRVSSVVNANTDIDINNREYYDFRCPGCGATVYHRNNPEGISNCFEGKHYDGCGIASGSLLPIGTLGLLDLEAMITHEDEDPSEGEDIAVMPPDNTLTEGNEGNELLTGGGITGDCDPETDPSEEGDAKNTNNIITDVEPYDIDIDWSGSEIAGTNDPGNDGEGEDDTDVGLIITPPAHRKKSIPKIKDLNKLINKIKRERRNLAIGDNMTLDDFVVDRLNIDRFRDEGLNGWHVMVLGRCNPKDMKPPIRRKSGYIIMSDVFGQHNKDERIYVQVQMTNPKWHELLANKYYAKSDERMKYIVVIGKFKKVNDPNYPNNYHLEINSSMMMFTDEKEWIN